jgi:formylglycine-generating enzyme required for sulfatase activity
MSIWTHIGHKVDYPGEISMQSKVDIPQEFMERLNQEKLDLQSQLERSQVEIAQLKAQLAETENRLYTLQQDHALLQSELDQAYFDLNRVQAQAESGNESSQASQSFTTISSFTTPKFETKEASFQVVTIDAQGQQVDNQTQTATCFKEDLGDGIKLDMVEIPAGTFMMGSLPKEEKREESESPTHQVTLKAFYMSQVTVTQMQWRAVAEFPQVERSLNPEPATPKTNNHPIECVSWYDAVEFCARLAKSTGRPYRLPTEAEWEYACRAGTQTPFHFGETLRPDLANYDGNHIYANGPQGIYREGTTPVGSFEVANYFGLYDVHGNVWEWCADLWHDNYQGAPIDGKVWDFGGDARLRLLRGGSWDFNPGYCRSAQRARYAADLRYFNISFRVACDLF